MVHRPGLKVLDRAGKGFHLPGILAAVGFDAGAYVHPVGQPLLPGKKLHGRRRVFRAQASRQDIGPADPGEKAPVEGNPGAGARIQQNQIGPALIGPGRVLGAADLEGLDDGNIILSSSRRRSTYSGDSLPWS